MLNPPPVFALAVSGQGAGAGAPAAGLFIPSVHHKPPTRPASKPVLIRRRKARAGRTQRDHVLATAALAHARKPPADARPGRPAGSTVVAPLPSVTLLLHIVQLQNCLRSNQGIRAARGQAAAAPARRRPCAAHPRCPAAHVAQGPQKPPVVLPSSSPAVASSNLNRSSPVHGRGRGKVRRTVVGLRHASI